MQSRWKLIREVGIEKGHMRALVICVCGVERTIRASSFYNGASKSCGCSNVDHGQAARSGGGKKSSEYVSWCHMKQRCYNPKDKDYRHYGGRGIIVSDSWKNSFPNFLSDLGPKPSGEHSLERINNDGAYEKGNVVWATAKQQANNRRTKGVAA